MKFHFKKLTVKLFLTFLTVSQLSFSQTLFEVGYTEPERLNVNAGSDTYVQNGGNTTLNAIVSGGSGEISYVWTPDDLLVNADTPDPVAYPAFDTEYLITVTDEAGCIDKDTLTIFISYESGISDNDEFFSFEVFPNPNTGIFTLLLDETGSVISGIELIDVTGKIVFSENINTIPGHNSIKIDTQNTPKGFYLLKINSESGSSFKNIIIK